MAIQGLDFKYKCNICGDMRPYDMESSNKRGMCASCNMDVKEDEVPVNSRTLKEIMENSPKKSAY